MHKNSSECDQKLRYFFMITILMYFLLGMFGRYTPLTRMLIPLRYHVNMFQYMAFPAALGIISSIGNFKFLSNIKRFKVLKITMLSLSVAIPMLLVTGISGASNETNPIAWFYSRNLCHHIDDNTSSEELIQWLSENTSKEGRILIESIWSPMEKEQENWFL